MVLIMLPIKINIIIYLCGLFRITEKSDTYFAKFTYITWEGDY